MIEVVSIARDGAPAARAALERCVHSGGVALFPADGLYGLACDPLRAAAIARIHALKGRDESKPSAVMYLSPLVLRELVGGLGDRSREAVATLLPGAFTLVLANPDRHYPLACCEDPERLGVRLIGGPLAGASCVLFQTSSNRSGQQAPARFEDVEPGIAEAVDLAIDGGALQGSPSTVVDLTEIEHGGAARLLRVGAASRSETARLLGEIDIDVA